MYAQIKVNLYLNKHTSMEVNKENAVCITDACGHFSAAKQWGPVSSNIYRHLIKPLIFKVSFLMVILLCARKSSYWRQNMLSKQDAHFGFKRRPEMANEIKWSWPSPQTPQKTNLSSPECSFNYTMRQNRRLLY